LNCSDDTSEDRLQSFEAEGSNDLNPEFFLIVPDILVTGNPDCQIKVVGILFIQLIDSNIATKFLLEKYFLHWQ
jgi:hypothetical protein